MSTNDWQEQWNAAWGKWGQLVVRSWEDEALHKRILSDPVAVLKENGIDIPAGVAVKVVQNTASLIHLPMMPKPGELSDDQLDAVSGGAGPAGAVARPVVAHASAPSAPAHVKPGGFTSQL